MKRKSLFESLEPRSLLTAVLPAYADAIGLSGNLDPTPTFVDEFDGTALDTTKWQTREASRHRLNPTSQEFAYTTADAVKVSNGELNLVAHNDPVTGRFESGWIQTAFNGPDSELSDGNLVDGSSANFTQAYGYWEAKLKMSSISGMWNAFWVHRYNMPEVANDPAKANRPEIYGTEMDVVEQSAVRIDAAAGNTVHTTTHANGYASQHISSSAHTNVAALPSTGSSVGDYHIYGLLWSPTAITVYIDGRAIYTETNPSLVSKAPHMAILSNEIGAPGSKTFGAGRNSWGDVPTGGYGSVDTSTARLTADYVRVWKLTGSIATPPPPAPAPAPIPLPPVKKPTLTIKPRAVGGLLPTAPSGPGGGSVEIESIKNKGNTAPVAYI